MSTLHLAAETHAAGPAGIPWQHFPSWDRRGLHHAFSLRGELAREELDENLPAFLRDAGFSPEGYAEGAQTHGNAVARVDGPTDGRVPDVDALITATSGLALVVRVADCGPVYFHDPVTSAIGLAHSGRKGTEGNITAATLEAMAREFGSRPADVRVLLGPCIRPPHYEVAFAAMILDQAREAGATDVHDSAACTACDLDRYYSYRLEKGHTGRHWAVLMLL